MNSWDFFDTLCGRSCGEPWRVFDLVGGEEYRRLRQDAERRSDKTWNGIFSTLAEITGWPAERIGQLQSAEWLAELSVAFPIAENVGRVRPGDRIVTDTYFSARQIRQLADAIGLPEDLEVVASWDGKYSGAYWKTPAARGPAVHVGDNPRSDHAKPAAAGLPATLYAGGRPTAHELAWEKAGLWEIAAASRAARLQNPHDPKTRQAGWWDGAARANVPFLLTAAAMVRAHVEVARPDRVLFVTRDATLLGKAYRTLYDATAGTFFASRETLRRPSAAYLEYARTAAAGSLLVDLHGTGRTARAFSEAHGIGLQILFVCSQRRLQRQAPEIVNLASIANGTAVEVMNYDDLGRVVDVRGDLVSRATVEYDLDAVRVHRAASLAGIAACCRPPQGVTAAHVSKAAEEIRRVVPRDLVRQHQVEHPQADKPGKR